MNPVRVSENPNGIEVVGVSKSLRGHQILSGVDLVVPWGRVAVIEGDNGAGKTTLVRILATVVTADTGSVRVAGHCTQADPLQVRHSIGVSFANERSLYWRITGYQNLDLFGAMAGLTKRVVKERAREICEDLHIGEVSAERVGRMSTGQRQRLMVARALLTRPSVLLLDEPFRGLDEDGLEVLMAIVRARAAEGTAVLIAAPLIGAIEPVADATYRLRDGGLEQLTTERREREPSLSP